LQIAGPAGAYVVIVYGIVVHYGVANLVGARSGRASCSLRWVSAASAGSFASSPCPIVIGLTNGIAVLILLFQVSDFAGLGIAMPDEFFTRLRTIAASIGAVDPVTVAVGTGCLAVLWLWPKSITTGGEALEAESRGAAKTTIDDEDALHDRALSNTMRRGRQFLTRLPGPMVMLVAGSLAVALLRLDVETIGTRFGRHPAGASRVRLARRLALHAAQPRCANDHDRAAGRHRVPPFRARRGHAHRRPP
jgi:SulP family sulfate permease